MQIARKISCSAVFLLLFTTAALGQAHPLPPSAPPSQTASIYNPMAAHHDVDVGKFYMKRGDIDGAIVRFKDAIRNKSDYPEPRLLLGQAYEKKGDPREAVEYYQQYLKILPDTTESKKVRERITALKKEIAKNNSTPLAPDR